MCVCVCVCVCVDSACVRARVSMCLFIVGWLVGWLVVCVWGGARVYGLCGGVGCACVCACERVCDCAYVRGAYVLRA